MQDWEKDKLPLVCPEWRLSNNCPYAPRICKYLHRNKDGNGRDIEVANIDGKLLPKMRIPPVTCLYWMREPYGCRKTDAECKYAHYNTGWLAIDIDTAPVRIDPDEKPSSEQGQDFARPSAGRILSTNHNTARVSTGLSEGSLSEQRQDFARPNAGLIPGTNRNTALSPVHPKEGPWSGQRPSFFGKNTDKTCWYWANGGCEKPDEMCSFKHYDTGVVAQLGPRPVSSKSPLPCYYFLRGTCIYSAEQCRRTHIDPNHRNAEHSTSNVPLNIVTN